ncbi:unnamed protein product [Heterobilharzia americana]|nr:unnamed protein product [Heterobilharzia americana]
MRESSRTRWNTARSTENRCRDNSGHAHTTIAEGVEGREGTWLVIGRRVTLSNCRRRETSVLARTGAESLSCPPTSKILSRIILERLKDALDSKLRPEQAGFRKYKSCADQIATLRIIIEQSIEWQSALYLNFIDFEKAFDSVDREVIWKLLQYYGVPQTFIRLIQQLYEDATCQVIHNGKLSDAFEVKTGVKQGCLLSPMIFLIVVDWIMQQTVGSEKRGIHWTTEKNLEDLDFADDLCLMSHKLEDLQAKTNKLIEEAGQRRRDFR